MKQLIIKDELAMCADNLKKDFSKAKGYKDIFFIGDCNFICDYLMQTLQTLNKKNPRFQSITYFNNGTENYYRKNTLKAIESVQSISRLTEKDAGKNVILFFVNCVDGLKDKKQTLKAFDTVIEYMNKCPGSRCVVSVLLPQTPVLPDGIKAFSEREYNFYVEKNCNSDEFRYYIDLEKACRKAVLQNKANITLLRFDNVFAPDIMHTPSFDLEKTIKECYSSKTVEINDNDVDYEASVTYIRTACHAVFFAVSNTRRGNIYNVAHEKATNETVKELIYSSNADIFSIKKHLSAGVKPQHRVLESLKFKKCNFIVPTYFDVGIKHLVSYITGEDYDTSDNVEFYKGKIKQIQKLEVKLLLEIDRICRKHNIKYFLAGGSLLGAVRSGMSIEWDDDLDIGMLREDFEKFRKIAPKELGPEFSYSSPFNKSGSHYTIDKIRLNDTYFSTNFSNRNQFPDGIFIDILVYDKTSNNKLFQKLHAVILTAITHTMLIKWWGAPRISFHYRFSKIFMPIIKFLPWSVYNGLFDFFAKLYRYKKNAHYLIDTVGKKVNDGPLPNKGLDEVVYVDFEGIKAPIPVDPVPYLTYAYGERYMEKPVFSMRCCPHNFARIDLGKYILDTDENESFRKVDVRGELFENELK